mgnify:CR=1 FL=1
MTFDCGHKQGKRSDGYFESNSKGEYTGRTICSRCYKKQGKSWIDSVIKIKEA